MIQLRFALVPFLTFAACAQTTMPYQNTALPAAERAHDLVSRMTLEEKASQLEDWAVAIPRLGVPEYQTWNEALHGVANAGYATVFPQAIGTAATWDPAMVGQIGHVISTEARAKFNQAQREGNRRIFYGLSFWSPNINIFRDPRWGRGQETYGEDPFLTARMGVAFVEGVQGNDPAHPRAVATSKHFAVHSGPESQRHTIDVPIGPRDLEETYLPAFRATVTEAGVKSVMCAYNSIDGDPACSNTNLLKTHLREAWGFHGVVVSDCGAIVDVANGHHAAPDITHAAAISLKAGTDLSCSIWAPGFNTLAEAVHQHLATEAEVTQAAERLFTMRIELGMFDPPGHNPLDAIPPSENLTAKSRALALKDAEESMVLLQNNGVLPLKPAVRHIAVVGPTAELLLDLEGNYDGTPLNPVTPLEGIRRQFPAATITYAQGATLAPNVAAPVPSSAFPSGLRTDYYTTTDGTGRPVHTQSEPQIQHDWRNALPVPEVETHDYSVRWTGSLAVPARGKYAFTLAGDDGFPYSPRQTYKVMLDGKVLSEGVLNPGKPAGSPSAPGASPSAPPVMSNSRPADFEVTFSDTHPHQLEVFYSHSGDRSGGGVTLSWVPPAQALLDEASRAAAHADVIVAFVGLSPHLEGEEMPVKIPGFDGGDRTSVALPDSQQHLLETLGATGKPVIVVSLSGSALALSWAKLHAAAVLQAWYPGVEGGNAIANTLAGKSNPAGRLPVTFYAGVNDLPAFTEYAMKNRTYRYYTGEPLWSFGYGLSYSHFRYSGLKLDAASVPAGQPLTATVTVTNNSARAGDEVVQAYVTTPQTGGPLRALAAFERVHLAAGQSLPVTLHLTARSLSSVDEAGTRTVLPGVYKLAVGGAQPQSTEAKALTTFTVTGSTTLPK